MRVEGSLVTIGDSPLTAMRSKPQYCRLWRHMRGKSIEQSQIADSSYRVEGLGRFRINLHRERGRAAATVRALPSKIPALDELHLPAGVAALGEVAARAGDHRRGDRLGKDHDAGGARKRNQPAGKRGTS